MDSPRREESRAGGNEISLLFIGKKRFLRFFSYGRLTLVFGILYF